MTIDAATGALRWTPVAVGTSTVTVRVTDDRGASVDQKYDLVVYDAAVNRPPVIHSTPPLVAVVGQTYTYQVTATDPENQTLTYGIYDAAMGMGLPGDFTMDSATGLANWTPTADDVGTYSLRVTASDGSLFASQNFKLLVRTNAAPEISPISDRTVTQGNDFRMDVAATDADGDPLHYTLENAPSGMSIDSYGRITWPTASQALAVYSATVNVPMAFVSESKSPNLSYVFRVTWPRGSVIVSGRPWLS
jgi:hypothetical protein